MNLEISPDFEAYVCYLIVLAAGIFTAVRQVSVRLPSLSAWRLAQTYLLFLAYMAVPVALFWLLDRTGAINDTSFFGAMLVGFGYERILTGSMEKIQLPGEVSRLWQPFVAWADHISDRLGETLRNQQQRFKERLFLSISADKSKFELLNTLAREVATDVPALDAQLKKIETDNPNSGEAVILRKQATLLYNECLRIPDAPYRLHKRGVISKGDYYSNIIDLPSFARIFAFVLALFITFGVIGYTVYQGQRINYYVWRLEKRNASQLDQFRNHEHLAAELVWKDRTEVMERLVRSLRKPGVAVDRIDLIVGLLLQNRFVQKSADADEAIVAELIGSLRTVSVDVRARVHTALKFIFAEQARLRSLPDKLPAELDKWVPSQTVSSDRIEENIRLWNDAMKPMLSRTVPTPPTLPAGPAPASGPATGPATKPY